LNWKIGRQCWWAGVWWRVAGVGIPGAAVVDFCRPDVIGIRTVDGGTNNR